MKKRTALLSTLTAALLIILGCVAYTVFFPSPPAVAALGDGTVKTLPAPNKTGGMPLMQALAERHTNRDVQSTALDEQTLSDLLWAAWGINRENGKRTAPTAFNAQNLVVYVALEDGVWAYDATAHALTRVAAQDMRPKLGNGALALIYAVPDSTYAYSHAGAVYQNVGLFCASVGLANVVKQSGINAVQSLLSMPEDYNAFLIHVIGWPK